MREFTDATGERWTIEVNGGTIKRCLQRLEVDWGKPMEEPAGGGQAPLLRYFFEVAFMVDVIYVVCLPQARERGIDDEAFAGLLGGETLAAASDAFLGALSDFFRQIGRTEIPAVVERQRRIVAESVGVATSALEGDAADRLIRRELETLGKSCADTLQSPASTRIDTPTQN